MPLLTWQLACWRTPMSDENKKTDWQLEADNIFATIPLKGPHEERENAKQWYVLSKLHAERAEFWKLEYEKLRSKYIEATQGKKASVT